MPSPRTWSWQRWIAADSQDDWILQLEQAGCKTWTVTERTDRKRRLLAVYSAKRVEVAALHLRFGGQVRAVATSKWLPSRPGAPIRVGSKLHVVQGKNIGGNGVIVPQLIIPHGMAFGSGEHATTLMLLRALAAERNLGRVLDLGTGSGVLALAARLLGAPKIAATDFDPDAVRTARENEALNFAFPLVRWLCSDVLKPSRYRARYDLVLANLFSGLLIDAADGICARLAPAGKLWQSGILQAQTDEVVAAYRNRNLELTRRVRRGKWIMLQWRRRP